MSGDPSLVIRLATPADSAAVQAVLYDTFDSTWSPQVTPAARERFRREARPAAYFAQRGVLFRVAEYDGAVVGFVDWDGDFINALHVHSRQARRGVGARLMDLAESQIAAAGFTAARLETDTFNARARAFYAARGYVEADRYPDEEWGSGLVTLLLAKRLAG